MKKYIFIIFPKIALAKEIAAWVVEQGGKE